MGCLFVTCDDVDSLKDDWIKEHALVSFTKDQKSEIEDKEKTVDCQQYF